MQSLVILKNILVLKIRKNYEKYKISLKIISIFKKKIISIQIFMQIHTARIVADLNKAKTMSPELVSLHHQQTNKSFV